MGYAAEAISAKLAAFRERKSKTIKDWFKIHSLTLERKLGRMLVRFALQAILHYELSIKEEHFA